MEPTRSIGTSKGEDAVVVEEPLEIRVAGDTIAITMRTPGNDRELVLGFLLAEGIIRGPDDVSAIAHCGRPEIEERENVIEVTLAPGVKPPVDERDAPFARRGTITTSACGVCGRRSIDDLVTRFATLPDVGTTIALATITNAVQGLRERQPIFAKTGGCHAASLVRFDGTPLATFEDVGRHNAVDKAIGSQIRSLPLASSVLVVSGRSSFEIVQKAIAGRVPVVASVSAPSSLAIDLAARANVSLLGFVRGDSFTIYAGASRLV